MVYDKEYYEKNKEKFKIWAKNYKINNRPQYNETKKIWRHGKGKIKEKISKKKSDAKYHSKRKQDPEYVRKRKEAATEYNNRPEVKAHRKEITAKRRAKPEVKKRDAKYNKKYHEENPDKLLENNKKHLTKLGDYHNLKWYQLDKQLRGWSKIIHKDNNEICQVCQQPSEEAHHIFHKNKYPLLMFNRNNGIALCIKCHNQVHGKRLLESVIDPLNIIA